MFTPSSETPDDIGHAALVTDEILDTLHSYHTVRFRQSPRRLINGRYGGHIFKQRRFREYVGRRSTGSTRYTLSLTELGGAPVSVPPEAEQPVIAEILDTLDTQIRQTEALIAKLETVKQGLLTDLLTRGIDENGQLRPPSEEAPELYKDSQLGPIPTSWEITSLSEIADLYSGTTPSRTKHDRYFSSVGTLWVKTLDLNEDFLSETDEKITPVALRETSCRLHPPGTVLLAMYGGWEQIGRTSLLEVSATTNQAITALELRRASCVPEFVLRALQHGRPRWKAIAASTRKDPNITKSDVASYLIPLPPAPEQRIIVARFRTLLSRLELEKASLHQLRGIKDGLIDDLLTGRVRVTPLLGTAKIPGPPTPDPHRSPVGFRPQVQSSVERRQNGYQG